MCTESIKNSFMGTAFLCLRRSCLEDSPDDQEAEAGAVVSYNPPRAPEPGAQRMFRSSRIAVATSDQELDEDVEQGADCIRNENKQEVSGFLRRLWNKLISGNSEYESVDTRGASVGLDVETAVEGPGYSLRTASKFEESGLGVPTIATEEIVLPGSDLQKRMAHSASSTLEEQGDECVICMENFDETNPRMPTLCGCGENRTYFHLPCLYQWIEQDRNCPSCRKRLTWEEF